MAALSYKEIIKHLGQTVESKEIKDLLKKLGSDKLPKLVEQGGEYDFEVYFTLPKMGLNLIFELPQEAEPLKENEKLLALNCVQIYAKSTPNDITHGFAGEMPFGISFDDTKTEVHKKAGKPTDSKADLRVDLWDNSEPMFSVSYKKDGKVEMVAYEIEMLEDDGEDFDKDFDSEFDDESEE